MRDSHRPVPRRFLPWLRAPASAARSASRPFAVAQAVALAALGVLLATLLLTPFGHADAQTESPETAPARADGVSGAVVWVTEAEGVIDPPLADYLVDVIEEAQAAGAEALLIELDTPGGLDSSMRQIIQAEVNADIPVIVYVYPPGARSASAGVYIMMGADVAAMAPQTNLGAATPVSTGGEMDETMERKVVNDAVAYIRGLASVHDRNADWAEEAVREAVSLPAEEALTEGVIEFVADDRADLLEQMDGYTTAPKGFTLRTAGAELGFIEMSFAERFLHTVVNPNLAFIFLTIGIYGIIFELQSPGIGVGGVAGGISLLLGLYALQALPVTVVGIVLIALAGILLLAEIWVQSGGLLGIGGVVSLVLGGVLLFDSPESFLRVDWTVLAAGGLATLAFMLFVARAVAKARSSPATTGQEGMVDERGVIRSPLEPSANSDRCRGQVLVHGELWSAQATRPLAVGTAVRVVGMQGMTLDVEAVDAAAEGAEGATTTEEG